MAEDTKPVSQPFGEAAAQAVAPDAVTATLLAKHTAGDKLTASEYGKLGAFAAKAKAKIFGPGKSSQPAGHTQPGPGGAVAVGALSPGQASGDGLPAVPPDPRVVQRTTEAIIKACDSLARRKIATEARKAGADDRTANRFDSAAGVPAAAKDMMVETSPDVVAALGLDPSTYPIATFIGGLGLWATNLWLCVDELKALQRKKTEDEKPAAAPAVALGTGSQRQKGSS